MLFAERLASSTMTRDAAETMGTTASRAVSSCLQVRAERISDKIYPDGEIEFVWRLTDKYSTRPVEVFTVVRYEPASRTVSRTAIRVEPQEVVIARPGPRY
jgi:hypothetical protein